ncbi:MAG TPA: methionine synthase, partial [Candidatus Binatia bacterium]
MKHSTERILTTHCGSLARPKDLLDLMKAKLNNEPYDHKSYDERVQTAVSDAVRKQVESGIDAVTDGEQSKPGFFAYVRERLSGFEAKTPPPGGWKQWAAEVAAFPEYYENYFSRRMMGGSIAPRTPMVCTGPISYRGQDAIRKDIENLKAALRALQVEDAFMPAVAPSGVGTNEYYRSDEEYLQAVGDALRIEYQAIADAGFVLQIDDPWLTEVHSQDPSLSFAERREIAERSIEALNYALRGIPSDKIRFHTCYGINEGPRVHDAPLQDIVDLILKV